LTVGCSVSAGPGVWAGAAIASGAFAPGLGEATEVVGESVVTSGAEAAVSAVGDGVMQATNPDMDKSSIVDEIRNVLIDPD
jgi:hypothetical protein